MNEWWHNLTPVNRTFFSAAAFFSVFFVWQILAALMGLGDHDGADDVGGDGDVGGVDAHDGSVEHLEADGAGDSTATMVAFKLLSLRAIITFFMLFTWGSALYLNNGLPLGKAMGVAALWGLGGMVIIASMLALMPKLTDTGTKQIATALGQPCTVYLDIPSDGQGEVRVEVSGVVSYVKARTQDGKALKAGTPVTVTKIIDNDTVMVDVS